MQRQLKTDQQFRKMVINGTVLHSFIYMYLYELYKAVLGFRVFPVRDSWTWYNSGNQLIF